MYAQSVRGWLAAAGNVVHLEVFEHSWLEEIYRSGKWLSRIKFWQFLNERLKPGARDLLFFLYWDDVKPFWLSESSRARILPAPVVGIWMNTWGFRTPGCLRVSRRTLNRYPFLREGSLSLVILDEGVLTLIGSRVRAKLEFLPDFTDQQPPKHTPMVEALERFRQGKKLCLMIGAILGNKHPRLFLDFAKASAGLGWVFAVVGEVMVDWLPTEALDCANVRVWNGRVADNGEYNALLAQADLLWGVYDQWPGSSNLLTKAGLLGVPVVVSQGYLAEERVRCYHLGYVVDDRNTADLLSVLKTWVETSKGSSQDVAFCDDFSIDKAARAIVSLVDHAPQELHGSWLGGLRLFGLTFGQTIVNLVKALLLRGGPQ